jgi:hypothetical protein
MVRHVSMKTHLEGTALMRVLLLALVGCSPSPHERRGNPQGPSQRDVERDYTECEYKGRLATKTTSTTRASPIRSAQAPKSRATTLGHCTGYRRSTRCGIPVLQPRDREWKKQFPTLPPHEDNKDPRNLRRVGIARSRSIQHAHPLD